jgi:hypothetical protein
MLFDSVPFSGKQATSMHLRRDFNKDIMAVFLLTAIWILAEILINPSGEFPLNDDWSYTLSLRHLYESHRLQLEGWTSMPLLAQLVWAFLFCKIFGFSFTVLRFSTLVLGLSGGLYSYFLMREFSDSKKICFIAALILLFNPIYLNLSNTFMTDVPFISFLLLSLLFFVRGIRQDKLIYVIWGVFFALISTLIRQLGLLAVCSFSIIYLVRGDFKIRPLLISTFSLAFPLALYLLYNHWIKAYHNYPVKYDEGISRLKSNLFSPDNSTPKFLLRQGLNIFIYSGFFIFPFIFVLDLKQIWRRRRFTATWFSLAIAAIIGFYCLFIKSTIPFMGNIINDYGLGPVSMRDITILKSGNLEPVPGIVWKLIHLTGIVGGGCLLFAVTKYVKAFGTINKYVKAADPGVLILLCFAVLYSLVMLIGGSYDRYLIPLIPVCCVLLFAGFSEHLSVQASNYSSVHLPKYISVHAPKYIIIACLTVFIYGLFSISATSNYLSWNRARWNALHYLTDNAGIKPGQIDGGFEFNGYYLYNTSDITMLKQKGDPAKKSWWWVNDDTYLIAFGPVRGYDSIKAYPYNRFLSAAVKEWMYILKKRE